jgi:four helix bundle protein
MAFLFENLKVYQMSHQLADEITSLTETFPKGKYYLSDQLNRAILSIPNNIAEGNGRFHKNDRKHFFHISRGSAYECVCLLEMCKKKGLIAEGDFARHKDNLDEICRMIMGLINGLDK